MREAIEKWMDSVLESGGIERLDDLHIDQINPIWKDRHFWLSGGLESLQLAIGVRDRKGLDLRIALAYSLQSGNKPLGVDFKDKKELSESFDWSPPSLYLFHIGREPWIEKKENTATGEMVVKVIEPSLFGEKASILECRYVEFLTAGSHEYSRSVFLVG